jgi:hypothetical protein
MAREYLACVLLISESIVIFYLQVTINPIMNSNPVSSHQHVLYGGQKWDGVEYLDLVNYVTLCCSTCDG